MASQRVGKELVCSPRTAKTAHTRFGRLRTKVLSLTDLGATQCCCTAIRNCATVVGEISISRIWTTIWSWWRHQMEAFSALLAFCGGNSPVNGEFQAQRPVTQSFDVFFDLGLYQQLSKQWKLWLFETPWRSLWHHCNVPEVLSGESGPFNGQSITSTSWFSRTSRCAQLCGVECHLVPGQSWLLPWIKDFVTEHVCTLVDPWSRPAQSAHLPP